MSTQPSSSSPPRRARAAPHIPPSIPPHFLSPTFSPASHALTLIDESPSSINATLSTLRTLRDHISSSLHATAPPWPALTPAIAALHHALYVTQSATPLRASLSSLRHLPHRDDYPPRMAAAVHRASQLSANVALASAVRDFANLLSAAAAASAPPPPPPSSSSPRHHHHHHHQQHPYRQHLVPPFLPPPPPLPDRFLARATALHRARQAATTPPLCSLSVLDDARANLARHHASLQSALEACLVSAIYAPSSSSSTTPSNPPSTTTPPEPPQPASVPPPSGPPTSTKTPPLSSRQPLTDPNPVADHPVTDHPTDPPVIPPSPPTSPQRPQPPVAPDVFPALVNALDLLGGPAHAASVLRNAAPSALVALVRDALHQSCSLTAISSPPVSPPTPSNSHSFPEPQTHTHRPQTVTTDSNFPFPRIRSTGSTQPPPNHNSITQTTTGPACPAHAFDPHLPPSSRAMCARVLERVRLSMTAVLRRLSALLDAVPDDQHAMSSAVRAIWRDMAAAMSSFVHVLLAFPPQASPGSNTLPRPSVAKRSVRNDTQERANIDLDSGANGLHKEDKDRNDVSAPADNPATAISLLPSMATAPQPPTLSAPHTSFAAPWRATPSTTEPFAALVHAVSTLTPSIYNLEVAHGPLQQFIMSSSRMRDSWRERSNGSSSNESVQTNGDPLEKNRSKDLFESEEDDTADKALPQLLVRAVDLFEKAVSRDVAKFMRAALGNRAGALLQPISLNDRSSRTGPLGNLGENSSIGGIDVIPTTSSSLTRHHHRTHSHSASQSGPLSPSISSAELPPLPQTALLIDVIASCLALAAAVPSVAARIGDVIDQHVIAPFCERAAYALDLVAGWSDSGSLLEATLASISDDIGSTKSRQKSAQTRNRRNGDTADFVRSSHSNDASWSSRNMRSPKSPAKDANSSSFRMTSRGLRRLRADPSASTRCLTQLCEQRHGDRAACVLLLESEWNAVVRLVSNARAVISELEGCIGVESDTGGIAPVTSGGVGASSMSAGGNDGSIGGADSVGAGALSVSISRGRLGDLAAAAAAAASSEQNKGRLSLRAVLRERGVSPRVHGAVAEAVGRTQPGCHALRESVIERGVALLHCEVVLHSFSSVVTTLCNSKRGNRRGDLRSIDMMLNQAGASGAGSDDRLVQKRMDRAGNNLGGLKQQQQQQQGASKGGGDNSNGANGLKRPSSIFKALPIRLSEVERGNGLGGRGPGSPIEVDEFGDPIKGPGDGGGDPELEEYGFPNSLLLEQKDWSDAAAGGGGSGSGSGTVTLRGTAAGTPSQEGADSPGRGDTLSGGGSGLVDSLAAIAARNGGTTNTAGISDERLDSGVFGDRVGATSKPTDLDRRGSAGGMSGTHGEHNYDKSSTNAMNNNDTTNRNSNGNGGGGGGGGGSDGRAVEGGRGFGEQIRGMDACVRANLGAGERDFVVSQADVGVGLGIRVSGDVCGRGDRDVATGARLFMDAAATVAADSLGWPVVESDYSVAEGVSHSASECRTLLFAAGML